MMRIRQLVERCLFVDLDNVLILLLVLVSVRLSVCSKHTFTFRRCDETFLANTPIWQAPTMINNSIQCGILCAHCLNCVGFSVSDDVTRKCLLVFSTVATECDMKITLADVMTLENSEGRSYFGKNGCSGNISVILHV